MREESNEGRRAKCKQRASTTPGHFSAANRSRWFTGELSSQWPIERRRRQTPCLRDGGGDIIATLFFFFPRQNFRATCRLRPGRASRSSPAGCHEHAAGLRGPARPAPPAPASRPLPCCQLPSQLRPQHHRSRPSRPAPNFSQLPNPHLTALSAFGPRTLAGPSPACCLHRAAFLSSPPALHAAALRPSTQRRPPEPYSSAAPDRGGSGTRFCGVPRPRTRRQPRTPSPPRPGLG